METNADMNRSTGMRCPGCCAKSGEMHAIDCKELKKPTVEYTLPEKGPAAGHSRHYHDPDRNKPLAGARPPDATTLPQPAAVSAPSDEPVPLTISDAFKAVGGWMNGGELGYPSFGSMDALRVYTQKAVRGALAARAAAPVSGQGASIEQIQWRNIRKVVQALATHCFGSAGHPVYGSCYTALVTSLTAKDGVDVKLESLNSSPRISEEYGQVASIDNQVFRDLLGACCRASAFDLNRYENAVRALVVFIDSRPRSEDSRVKVLEEAAQACENERVGETDSEGDLGYNMAIKHAAEAIRALASTQPKADNE